ncbi:MAG: penicillin-binding protein 2, partial [Elusimicrobiota bacterium]|nr:penicillin-binding protein 2 [Elusimicrobiota bacterium]
YFCFPQKIISQEEKRNAVNFVNQKLKIPKDDFLKKLKKYKKFFWLIRLFCDGKIDKIDLPKGIERIKEEKRFYPNGKLASHVLGYTGFDGIGLSGIEYSMEYVLRGSAIKFYNEKDAKGRQLNSEEFFKVENLEPQNLYLTIDKNIQFIAEEYLEELYKNTKAEAATIIIQNIKTGEIIALANFPNFDGNELQKNIKLLKNDGINKVYEPGSTIKVLIAGAALEDNLYKIDDKIYCEKGRFKVYNHIIRDHDKKFKELTLEEILIYSSNIGMAKIGEKMGKNRLYYYLQKFGFGNNTGIDLPGEEKGLLKHPKNWDKLSEYILPFGQGFGVTAIQTIAAISAIGNKGIFMEPKIIKSIQKDGIIYEQKPREIRQIFSEKVCKELLNAMENVVMIGTAKVLQIEGYRIGAKTGTAQKIDRSTGKYSKESYISSLIGIFPLNEPQFSILAVVDSPKGVYYGGEVCGETMRKIIKDMIYYYKIPKSL